MRKLFFHIIIEFCFFCAIAQLESTEFFTRIDSSFGILNSKINEVYIDSDDNVWFSDVNGVTRFCSKNILVKDQHLKSAILQFSMQNGLPENKIVSICEDDDGKIWMASQNKGIAVWDRNSGGFEYITMSNGLANHYIYDIEKDHQNHIWVATKNGVSRINAKTKNVKNYFLLADEHYPEVTQICTDRDENIWFCIKGGKLTRWINGKFQSFGIEEGIKHSIITSGVSDNNKNTWFISYTAGLLKFDGYIFKQYRYADKGLLENVPQFIIADHHNNIWLGMNKGIQKFDFSQGHFRDYSTIKELGFFETSKNAAALDSKGYIWFGTNMGLIRIDPSQDNTKWTVPSFKIHNLKIASRDTIFPADAMFSYRENHLTFGISAMDSTNPNEVYYAYKLAGLTNKWTPATKKAEVTYASLKPGKYTLFVKARNASNVWSIEPKKYSFELKVPFWQNNIFLFFLFLGSVFILVFVLKIRGANLQKQRKLLEHQVSIRTAELFLHNERVQKQKQTIEHKNNQITESINYASSIQTALLPTSSNLQSVLPEYFIYFKAKDIVSGDFFWIHKKEHLLYIASIDCSGHGVPGALLSIIAYNLLEKIVNESGTKKPATILAKLSQEIKKVLRQDKDANEEGMDIALCALDLKNKQMEYAGAKSPLLIVRQKNIMEYKPEELSINNTNHKQQDKFNNHLIDLDSNDMIYLFSDGFINQIGVNTEKKYGYNRFKDLLLEIANLPVRLQHIKIDKTMEEWKGECPQLEDMLIWGIRI